MLLSNVGAVYASLGHCDPVGRVGDGDFVDLLLCQTFGFEPWQYVVHNVRIAVPTVCSLEEKAALE